MLIDTINVLIQDVVNDLVVSPLKMKGDDIIVATMDVAQQSVLALLGGGTPDMDVAQVSTLVMFGDYYFMHMNDIFVSSSSDMFGRSTTTVNDLNVTLPDLSDVDLDESIMLAAVMHRSVCTPPAGWTLVKDIPNGGNDQVTAIYKKDVIEIEDSSVVTIWSQSSGGRMIVQVFVLSSGVEDSMVVIDQSYAETGTDEVRAYPITTSNEWGVAAFCVASWNLSSGSSTFYAPNMDILTQNSTSNVRLGASFRVMDKIESLDSKLTSNYSGGDNNMFGCITLRLGLEEII